MSSATSIDPAGAERLPGAPDTKARPAGDRDTFKPWHFFVLMSLLAATAAVIAVRQSRPEHLVVISLTIGAAGFAAGALYRTLAPLVQPEGAAIDQPLTDSARALIEREKMLALRAIKELEFDRAMGKVSPKDFDEMAGRLRSRAITLMRQLDANAGYRELIERELSARVSRAKDRTGDARTVAAPAASPDAVPSTPSRSVISDVCACGTRNDPDAAFCKRCGTKLAAAHS